jgi:PhoD-like phosphatase
VTGQRARWAIPLGIAWCGVLGVIVISGSRPGAPEPPILTATPERMMRLGVLALTTVGLIMAVRWRRCGGAVAGLGAVICGGLWAFAAHPVLAAAAGAVPLGCAVVLAGRGWRLQRWRTGAAVVFVALCVLAGVATWKGYGFMYGATHPSSNLPGPARGGVVWAWSGGVTQDRAVITARIVDAETRVDVTTTPPGSVAISRSGDIIRADITSLPAGTAVDYTISLDGRDDGSGHGSFRTMPRGAASFAVVFSSCARTGSNGAVFDTIRLRRPLMYLNVGDLYYANIEGNEPRRFRGAFDRVLTRPAQANLYRATSTAYIWDDHDFGPNDSDGTSASAPAAHGAYRMFVPHHRLALAGPTAPLAQAFTIGRVRFIVTDTRSARSPSGMADGLGKTILGNAQRQWFERELVAARDRGQLVAWVNPVPWIGRADTDADGWAAYPTERRAIADYIARERITALVMLSGDTHAVAIDDGTHSGYATSGAPGFPVAHGGALDRAPQQKGGPYSEGVSAGGGRFGTLAVEDDGGPTITVDLSGRDWRDSELVRLRRTFDLPHRKVTRR